MAIAIHGYGRPDRFLTVLVGGGHRRLATHVARHLRPGLAVYDVVDALDDIPVELRGLHPDNPVNRARHGGVQIELPPRVRGLGPYWLDRDHERTDDGLTPHTEALIAGLAAAASSWTAEPEAASEPHTGPGPGPES